jgi:spermidine synthase
MKTIEFYKGVQRKLAPGGVVVINLNEHLNVQQDITTIAAAFAHTYVFRVPGNRNFIVVGAAAGQQASPADLRVLGRKLDQRFQGGFSFERMVDHLLP